ncbi:MAG: transglycosylase family protein [Solirubrobacteraceae bacterium]|nr:transglycosylase family protein [Solirubrobacteraceae bacterium]
MPTSSAAAQSPGAPASVKTVAANAPGDLRSGAKRVLINRNMFLTKRLGRVERDALTRRERSRRRTVLWYHSMPELRRSTRRVAAEIRRERAERDHGGAPNVPIPGALRSIAACESNGNPRAISAGGTYRGKYQFSFSTWASVGGKGDPAAASETEQDRRAAILYRTGGPGHWPVCGR